MTQVEGSLGEFVRRLVALGATTDEIDAVVVNWDVRDEDGTYTTREASFRADDRTLRDLIHAAREEYRHGMMTEAEAEEAILEERKALAWRSAYEEAGGTIGSIMEWVGTDPIRAQAMISHESGADGAKRAPLIAQLRAVSGG